MNTTEILAWICLFVAGLFIVVPPLIFLCVRLGVFAAIVARYKANEYLKQENGSDGEA